MATTTALLSLLCLPRRAGYPGDSRLLGRRSGCPARFGRQKQRGIIILRQTWRWRPEALCESLNPRCLMVVPNLAGHLFIVPGDITQRRADVIIYSTSTALRGTGHLYAPFAERFSWFAGALAAAV